MYLVTFFQNIILKGFDVGIKFEGNGNGWINENFFSGQIQSCHTGIHLIGADGNKFNGVGQSGTDTRASFIECNDSSYNYFDVFAFDVGQPNLTQTYAKFYNGSKENIVTQAGSFDKYIKEESPGFNIIPQEYKYLLPSNGVNSKSIFNGMQDNFLIGADKRFLVTETLTNVIRTTATPVDRMFMTNGDKYTEYQFIRNWSKNDKVEINIDLRESIPIHFLGVSFGIYGANKLVMSVFDGTNWHERIFDNNKSNFVTWNTYSEVGHISTRTISKIRITFSKPTRSGDFNPMRITGIFASSTHGGYAYLPTTGGDFYGDMVAAQTGRGFVVKTPDGTKKYRLGVDNNGQIIATLI